MEMYGYEVFNSNFACDGVQYEIGKKFKHDGEIAIGKSGFHFFESLEKLSGYFYLQVCNDMRLCRVKAVGKIIRDGDLYVTDEIEILEEIEFTPKLLNELAHSDTISFRRRVAFYPDTDPEILKFLAEDEDITVRMAVAGNPNTDPKTLDLLSKDRTVCIREAVAKHSNTKLETQKDLAKDEYWTVRAIIAQRCMDPETLDLLSNDKNKHVRWAVAMNRNTKLETRRFLAKDEDARVREAIARNWNIDPEILATKLTPEFSSSASMSFNSSQKNNQQTKGNFL